MAISGRRPTKAELRAAVGRRLPDVIGHDLKVLFCGINPGLYSAAVGHHFARPGNRFWTALQAAGFTRRVLHPSENRQLLDRGYGLTDLVARATAKAEELAPNELVAGRRRLQRKVHKYTPRWVAVLGIGAFRVAFRSPDAQPGPQPERIADARIWVLPNPSGLNAGHSPAALADAFRMLRRRASRTPAERR
jgi:TDG/mug DNA glycosylase family protein